VSKFEVHTSSKDVMMYSNLKDSLELYETLREMCPIFNHVWTYFTRTIYFFDNIMEKICFHIIFKKKLTKFPYYCNYYVVNWRKMFELSLEDNSIFHPSLGNEQ
jgi:hypothetical protein